MIVGTLDERWTKRLAWAAFLAWSALIWVANTRPNPVQTRHDALNDVLWQGGHLLGHAVLGVLAWRAATRTWGHTAGYWVALLGTIAHSVLDEGVQFWVPTRHPMFEDVVYNVAGAMLGIIVCEVVRLLRGAPLTVSLRAAEPRSLQRRPGTFGRWPHDPASGGDGQREELDVVRDAAQRRQFRRRDGEG